MTKNLKTPSKISVRIAEPILKELERKIESACLRRDAYLCKVLEHELGSLDEEVTIPNSQASYDYVFGQLEQFPRKLVSLALPPELTTRLNEICARKRIVRDAFFNRLFLLLAVSPRYIDLFFFDSDSSWRTEVWSEFKHDGPFFDNVFEPLEANVDPFWAIRAGLEMQATGNSRIEDCVEPSNGMTTRVQRGSHGTLAPVDSLYTKLFAGELLGGNLLALNCYLPDELIPDHPAEKKARATLDELLGVFFDKNQEAQS